MLDQKAGNLLPAAARPLRSALIEDAAVQAQMQPWVEMECYQLGRGSQLGRVDNLDLGSQQVVRESQLVGVQKLGYFPPELCTVSCCRLDAASRADDRFNDLAAGGRMDTLFFLPGDVEYDIYVPAGAQTDYVLFDQDEFLRGARALDPAQWERAPRQLISLNGTRQADLETAVNRWLRLSQALAAQGEPPDAGLMRRLVLHHVLNIVTATRPGDELPSSPERSRAFQVCRMARAFVEDQLAENVLPALADICAFVGVSERTLQYAFRTYVGMSPLAYLRLCRLNRVRVVLRACDPRSATVTQIAARFGFLHMGRFALDYRRVFEESPSATLAA